MSNEQKKIPDIATIIKRSHEEGPDSIYEEFAKAKIAQYEKILKEHAGSESEFPWRKLRDETSLLFSLYIDIDFKINKFRRELECIPLRTAITHWITFDLTFTNTHKVNDHCMTNMIKAQIIPSCFTNGEVFTIGGFKHIRHTEIIDYIKTMPKWSKTMRKNCVECYKGFLDHLHDRSFGWIQKLPSEEHYQLKLKTFESALTHDKFLEFISALRKNNKRDSLIVFCLVFGLKKLSEVLNLELNQVDFNHATITFNSTKTVDKKTSIKFPEYYMQELKFYINETSSIRKKSQLVFVTKNGKPVTKSRLNYAFNHAKEQTGIKKISPDLLRATWITLTKQKESTITENIRKILCEQEKRQ